MRQVHRDFLCFLWVLLIWTLPAGAATVNATWNAATDVAVSASSYIGTGNTVNFSLNFAPPTGTNLTVINNTGLPFISGTFDNLAQGQAVALSYNGVTYKFVASYYGGTGNDLVLVWASNRIMGWGADSFGQIGDGDYTARHTVMVPTTATGVLAGRTVTALAQGYYHSLALLSDGTVASWGRNSEGQLGGNDFSGAGGAMLVSTDSGISALHGKTVVAVSAGGVHSLALCSDGSVVAWGSNSNGQLGNGVGVGIGYSVPVAVNTTNGVSALYGKTVVAISAGSSHSLALCSDGTVVAWGWNHDGQLGNNSTTDSSVPVAVSTTSGVSALYGQAVVAISSGSSHSLALRSDGTVVAWGYNGSGQLGDNTLTSRSVPVAANTTSGVSALYGKTVVALAGGGNHNVALCADGFVSAWGSNFNGQVGDNSTTTRKVPTAVMTSSASALSGKIVTAIAAVENNSRAVCSDGTVATWGYNFYGNLGNDSTTDSKLPVAVVTTPLNAGERIVTPADGANTALSMVLAVSPPPTTTTGAAISVGGTYATVNGTVNANNGIPVAVAFDYGITTAYGSNVPATPASVSGGSDTAVSASLTGLTPNTTYHFRVSGSGYSGSDQTFTTLNNNANLAGLTTTAGSLSPAFDSGTTRYNTAVAAGTTSVTVTPSVADSTATLKVNGVSLTSGSESLPASLGYGDNVINVLVTAQDGVTQQIYTVTVKLAPPTAITANYASGSEVPLTTNEYTATGGTVSLALNYAPVIGTNLMVVNNTGTGFITGTFSNLSQGQTVLLNYNNVGYEYFANYYGGTGNDLVLVWAKNRAFAWGWNDYGQIGDNSITARTVPVPVTATGVLAGKTITAFAVGESHSLALCSDGTVAAWGLNSEGQLGSNNFATQINTPVAVNTASGVSALYGKTVVAIAAGRYFSMALCSDGTVATWGSNNNGELGDTTTTNRKVPVAVNTASGVSALHGKTVTAIAAGAHHNVALCSDGTVVAWGYGSYGQIGDNTYYTYRVPVAVNTASGVSALYGKTVVALAAGFYHTLALCSDGSMASWGYNVYGALGDNTTTSRFVPVAVNAESDVSSLYGRSVVAIAAGGYHDLALCSDGTLLAWGHNGYGQLGDNSFTSRSVPVEVNTTNGVSVLYGKTLLAPACGKYHSAVQCADGTVAIWGSNGQLGNNAPNSSNVPVMPSSSPLSPGENFSQVASGSSALHTLALAAAPPPAPVVISLAPTSITTTSVTLNGTVNGNNSPTAVSFDYGPTTAYGTNLAATPASISSSTPTAVSVSLTGLTPGTTYHCRVNGVSGAGTSHGSDVIFTTLSTNAGLSGLVLSHGTLSPVFDTGTTNYTAAVTFPVTSVTLRPTLANAGASVTVNGINVTAGYASNPIALIEGDNTLTTVVTAQDGTTTQTYTVTVNLAPLPVWNAQGDVPLAINSLTATGLTLELPALNFAPAVGASLMVVNNTGLGFIKGTFDNLSQGQAVALVFNGVTYNYVANYYGGTGNDLVLLWAERHLVAWGANTAGELGNNSTVSRRAPVAVMTEGTPLALAAGAYHSVALFADGSLSSWGGNDAGQLGNGTLTNSSVPGPVTTVGTPLEGKVIAAIAAGAIHNLALCTDGTVAAWGDNGDGQLGAFFFLGDGSVPVEVMTSFSALQDKSVVAIGAGSFHSLALCSDGTLAAWGRNYHGALGNGSTGSGVFPGAVTTAGTPLAGRSVVAMAAGGYHNIALCSDNTVVTWGDNDYGQLGNSTNTSSSVPVAVTTAGTVLEGKTVVAVAAGLYHCVALCSDGTLAAWGQNEYGQLGRNSTTNSSVPVAVDSSGVLAGKTVSEVIAGASFSLVRCTDGTMAAWGSNAYGELGNYSLTNSSTPVLVAAGKSFMGVSAGSSAYHTLGQVVTPFPVLSSDATLSGLAVSPGALNTPYNSSTSSYLVVLDSAVASITITPTVNESHASITVNGQAVASGTATSAIPLLPGAEGNSIQVTVTAQDGFTQAQYVVFVACLSKVEQWRLQSFGLPMNAGPAADTADYDNDGICNLLEYALNLNPAAASKLPANSAINGVNYEYTYTRSTAAVTAGTTFTVEWSPSLSAASWGSSGVTETILSDDGTTQQVKAVIPMNAASAMFVHLSVTAPP